MRSLLTIPKAPNDPTSGGTPTTVDGYNYLGCYQATQTDTGLRLLRGPNEQRIPDLTIEACENYCATASGAPYNYFGVEDGHDCRCSNDLSWSNPDDDPTQCTAALPGNPSETAGGANRISVYQSENYIAPVRQHSNTWLESSMLCFIFVFDPG